MHNGWRQDIYRAILMTLVVGIIAVAVNSVRDPALALAVNRGLISPGTQDRMRAVNLVDNWSHEGKIGFRRLPDEPRENGQNGNGQNISTAQTEPAIYEIGYQDAKRLFDEGECLFIDARTVEEYEKDGHIPGAVNWPAESYDQYRSQLMDTIPFDQCLVVYCSNPACNDSSFLSSSLRNEGYKEIYWFEGGMESWLPMRYPVNFGPEP